MSIPGIKNAVYTLATQYMDPNQKLQVKEKIRGLNQDHRQLILDILRNPGKSINGTDLIALEQNLARVTDSKYVFEDPGLFKNIYHAVQHFFGARVYSTEVLDAVNKLPSKAAFFSKDATYDSDGKGIIDFSFASSSGFGYVADGTGHNNKMMAPVLGRIFNKFNAKYQKALQKNVPETEDEFKAFIKSNLSELGRNIHNEPTQVLSDPRKPTMTHLNDNTLKPAFSFAQVAQIDDKKKLFSVEFSDTMLLIKHANGTFERPEVRSSPGNYGLGDNSHPKRLDIQVAVTDVEEGAEIYGFTDGIGEFLSIVELQNIILNNEDSRILLDELKAVIIEKGKPGVYDEHGRKEINEISANGGNFIKLHDANESSNYDDISMFMLKVS